MKRLKIFTWIVLINIYLVIVAGSIVRMSGSGMGCPDWPKCFGYLIPPTDQSQLEWKENHEFKKGQIIIQDNALVVANSNFKTTVSYNQSNWENYTKHDYAVFNVYHTWTEYINRLFGALLGLFALIMIYFAARKWKINKWFLGLSIIQLFLIGFEAWLGKLTVDTNLDANMITYHMLGVTVMVVVQLLLLKLINREKKETKPDVNKLSQTIKYVTFIGIILMIIQIVLGTQVRQQTDVMMHSGLERGLIPQGFDYVFYIHRSFSFLLVVVIGYLYLKLKSNSNFLKPLNYLVVFTVLEIIAGIILFYFGMQAFAQPIHIILSILIYGFFVELFLKTLLSLQSSAD
jgi:cytochrome c oxidase assembly protein subunit 15